MAWNSQNTLLYATKDVHFSSKQHIISFIVCLSYYSLKVDPEKVPRLLFIFVPVSMGHTHF